MTAFLGISVWIALATVLPGLVTVSLVYCAYITAHGHTPPFHSELRVLNEWILAGVMVTVMLVTQFIGILLERLLVTHHWLGPKSRPVEIPEGIDPLGSTRFELKPYEEYAGIYLLLAEMRETEDSQGHLQRVIAQFFLTNNVLVSLGAGIVATIVALATQPAPEQSPGLLYLGGLVVALAITYWAARVRFDVMAKALWAARRRRQQELVQATEAAPPETPVSVRELRNRAADVQPPSHPH